MRLRKWRRLAVSALICTWAALASEGFAGIRRHDKPDRRHVTLGRAQPSVGFIDAGDFSGSGVLIDPEWVLTAAHLVDGSPVNPQITFDGTTYYQAADCYVHEKWDWNLLLGYDIALLHLDERVRGVRPAARYRGDGELGARAVTAGYGCTGTGLTGAVTYDGRKRAGTNRVDALKLMVGAPDILLMMDFDNPDDPADSYYDPAEPLRLEFLPSYGDSGGGLFLRGELAGIISAGFASGHEPAGYYGELVGCTRVSAFNDWIDGFIGGPTGPQPLPPHPGGPHADAGFDRDFAATATQYANGLSARPLSIPEPTTLGLLAVGAIALLRRRRG